MNRTSTSFLHVAWLLLSVTCSAVRAAEPPAPAQVEFFETRIRPVLVEHCYPCHNAARQTDGGLAIDSREGFRKGGDSGLVIVPGEPAKSRLLPILRQEVEGLKMPQGGAPLDAAVIADIETWIAAGAVDPRDAPPSEADLARTTSWDAVRERRQQWWSFRPIRRVAPPAVRKPGWSDHPVDLFIQARQEAHGLQPAPPADRLTLLRRATLILTGLPPTLTEQAAFLADESPGAYERLIERLLTAPAFGERWARHWMDLVRYCESHGSQGDPELPNAWRYRDYLIRAFNNDVPYDQLVREHLAGDLLPQPRLNTADGLNESILGIGHWRMVEFGFVPVDALDDQVKVVDNQIDVFAKAFLGLTVACARCHDHKFDPISQRDFYALYGVLASCRPGQVLVDAPERLVTQREELSRLKDRLRAGLADAWEAAVPGMIEQLHRQEQRRIQRSTLHARKQQLQAEIDAIERPAQAAVLAARGQSTGTALPAPLARWSFTEDARDSLGGLHGKVQGDGEFRDGRLILNGKNVVVRTEPLAADLGEKTLEVWVRLANRDQRGVGVITVETDNGDKFDSIVFNETEPGVWLAGSNYFQRTQPPGGQAEQAGPTEWLHLAIVYRQDNSITIYRNGQPYGATYTRGTLQTYPAGKGRVMFGQRHPGQGISYLAGEIDEARLYNRPLSATEVAASYQAGPAGVSRAEILATLPKSEAQRLQLRYDDLKMLQAELGLFDDATDPWAAALARASQSTSHALHAWTRLSALTDAEFPAAWQRLADEGARDLAERRQFNQQFQPGWNLSHGDLAQWFASGTGLSGARDSGPASAAAPGGEFSVERAGEQILRGILPAGVYTHGLSRKHTGVLTSPRFVISTDAVSIRALGQHSTARLVIENYALGNGGIYPATRLNRDDLGWVRLDTAYRKGAHAYVEFVTDDNDAACFGAGQVVFHDGPSAPREVTVPLSQLLQASPPSSRAELAERYADTLRSTIRAFREYRMSDDEVAYLDEFVRAGLLPATLDRLPTLRELVGDYRIREQEIALPRRAPGLYEAAAFDQPLFVRGRHTQPGEPVARRFLEAFGGTSYSGPFSGRLQLASEVASRDNPLTARVMVNRLWHHVFGKGLVGTVDNFGRLGDQPTHPELLDYLAARFVEDERWSIKNMLRLLLISRTFQQSAAVSDAAREADSRNDWLARWQVRRLEAEVIRDAILASSGQMDRTMYGPGVNVYFVNKTEGGGPKGPLDGERRRSIYQRIRRNAHNPFLEVFDAPRPSTTRGRRDVTTVPAQALALLNDPFVIDQAAKWAAAIVRENTDSELRVRRMFQKTLSRNPDAGELAAALDYLAELAAEHGVAPADIPGSSAVWQDLAHSVFCLKEFIYVP